MAKTTANTQSAGTDRRAWRHHISEAERASAGAADAKAKADAIRAGRAA